MPAPARSKNVSKFGAIRLIAEIMINNVDVELTYWQLYS